MEKKSIVKKIIQKEETTPQHFCVAEDCMLLEGGVLYGFTGILILDLDLDAISGMPTSAMTSAGVPFLDAAQVQPL